MSLNESSLFDRDYKTFKNFGQENMLALHDVFKESMRTVQLRFSHMNIIIRCQSLPHIAGNGEEIRKLFDELLTMLFSSTLVGSRLFLYVDCEEENSDAIDLSLSQGFKRYQIRFHTNITTKENWKDVNSQVLAVCQQILSCHHGSFLVNSNNKTGCLFSISLPGKLQ